MKSSAIKKELAPDDAKLCANCGKMLIGEYDYVKTKRGTEMYFCKGLACGRFTTGKMAVRAWNRRVEE